VYSFALIEAYRAVLDLTEIGLSGWGVAPAEVGREGLCIGVRWKGRRKQPPESPFSAAFSQVTIIPRELFSSQSF
jgi:hypothetical protein